MTDCRCFRLFSYPDSKTFQIDRVSVRLFGNPASYTSIRSWDYWTGSCCCPHRKSGWCGPSFLSFERYRKGQYELDTRKAGGTIFLSGRTEFANREDGGADARIGMFWLFIRTDCLFVIFASEIWWSNLRRNRVLLLKFFRIQLFWSADAGSVCKPQF